MCTVAAGAASQVPRPPTTATMAVTAAIRASPLRAIAVSEQEERHGVGGEVAEAAVQHRGERDTDQALGVARADTGRVQVAGEDVDDLDHPHDRDEHGDEREPECAARSLALYGGVERSRRP